MNLILLDKLPGPPQNVKVEILSDTEAKVSWDVPTINPHTASVYRYVDFFQKEICIFKRIFYQQEKPTKTHFVFFRVFWRPIGQKMSERQDTQLTFVKLSNLKPGFHYETVVKAGNSHGTSVLTEPVPFITEDNLISSASTGTNEVFSCTFVFTSYFRFSPAL